MDVWSLAIIYCCMSLRRFPWKLPRTSDNSYKLFIEQPDALKDSAQHRSDGKPSDQSRDTVEDSNSPAIKDTAHQQAILKGPWRLLRLLPRESRHIIGRMLKIDPSTRAGLEEVLADRWVVGGSRCVQEADGSVKSALGHQHTLLSDSQP